MCCFFLILSQPFIWITFQCNLNLHRKPRSMLCVVRMCSHKLYYSAPTEMGSQDTFCIDFRFAEFVSLLPHIFTILAIPFHILFYFCRIFFLNGFRNTISQDALIPSLINDKTTQVTVFPFWLLHLPLASTSLSGVQTFQLSSSIGDLVTNSLTDSLSYSLLLLPYKEHSLRLATIETFDQSDEET